MLMQNDLSATEQEEFRIRCRSALDGLETLLQSLLEISKMETGLIQINKKKLPLMDTVISAVNRTYPKADEKKIGSITKLMGFRIPHIINSAHINEF